MAVAEVVVVVVGNGFGLIEASWFVEGWIVERKRIGKRVVGETRPHICMYEERLPYLDTMKGNTMGRRRAIIRFQFRPTERLEVTAAMN
jgi:hypothetical protein